MINKKSTGVMINRNIEYHPFSDTSVDIIIPFHGQYHLVRKLMDSILKLTSLPKYKVILVDDGSNNKSFVRIWNDYDPGRDIGIDVGNRPTKKVFGIQLKDQKGFGAALQAGFEASSAPYVCFLNSDCVITSAGWLMEMGNTLLSMKDQGVRLVSARMNKSSSDIAALNSKAKEKIEDFIVEDHLPLICTLCHREMFSRIGGFVKNYPYGGYEDEELFWRMKKYKMKQAVCGSVWVHHESESTIKELWKTRSEVKKTMLGNFDLLKKDLSKMGY